MVNVKMSMNVMDASGLTEQDKKLIRSSWQCIYKDIRGHGISLFTEFFQNYPDALKKIHTGIKFAIPERLREDKILLNHSMMAMTKLNLMIKKGLDDDILLEHLLTRISVAHYNINVSKIDIQELLVILSRFSNNANGNRVTSAFSFDNLVNLDLSYNEYVQLCFSKNFTTVFMSHLRKAFGKNNSPPLEAAWTKFADKMLTVMKYTEEHHGNASVWPVISVFSKPKLK